MENDKRLPPYWHWKITPEQIEKIKGRDRDTVNKVYFDNLDKFKRMAYRYCGLKKQYSYFSDCVQQIYVDLIGYDYSNSRTLFHSIKHSFYRATGFSKYVQRSLDEPIGKNSRGGVLGDILLSTCTAEQDFECEEQEQHVLAIIAAQIHLTDKQRDILTAYAFNTLVYEGLFNYEYAKKNST